MKDHDIVDLYWARDERALTETQHKYGAYCHSISMNILDSHSDAEECVNDTWLKAWQTMPPKRPGVLRTYLGKLTRNLSINRLKERHREKRNPDLVVAFEELAECIPVPEDTTDELLCAYLNEFLEITPALDRQLFMGRYWYGRTVREMAPCYGLTANAVSQRLKRTRQALRTFLEERGYTV
ncbi:MAG: sigma-70 family RNA polymerase sigma factor [Ruminococcaceae bacterium]|nr:sigma-70 family RNA polymerase sigma factor [Oscillospiraceae bacterium]